jgi:hypothetical protein
MTPHDRAVPAGLVLAALITAVHYRDWGMLNDLIVVMRRAFDVTGPAPGPADKAKVKGYVTRVANAVRAGMDLPGCGDPQCQPCMPEVIRDPVLEDLGVVEPPPPPPEPVIIRLNTGQTLELDRAPTPGMRFIYCAPIEGEH